MHAWMDVCISVCVYACIDGNCEKDNVSLFTYA